MKNITVLQIQLNNSFETIVLILTMEDEHD